MLKKEIHYISFDGKPEVEVAYFNLNKVECARLSAKAGGDIEKYAQQIADSGKMSDAIEFLIDVILTAYGKREGDRFVKNPQLRSEFEYGIAFGELFEELITNPEELGAFIDKVTENARQNRKGSSNQDLHVVTTEEDV